MGKTGICWHGRRAVAAAAAALAFGMGAAAAGELVVGTGERHAFTNVADAVQEGAVRLSPRSTLVKTGAGRLELKDGSFTENAAVAVDVHDGAIAFTASEPAVSAYPRPSDELLGRAAFWLEAATNLKKREGELESWLDVRETGTGAADSPYAFPRAVAFTNDWLTAFPLVQAYEDKPGVWFRGQGSGCFMNWVKPDGSQAKVSGIRHAFIVHGGPTTPGDVLGQRGAGYDEPYFQRGGAGPDGNIWINHGGENRPMHAARTYLNGEMIDPFVQAYPKESVHVVEVEALGGSLAAMCFFNDRDMQLKTTAGTNMAATAEGRAVNAILGTASWTGGGSRAGGEYVFEMVLFTNNLTSAERLEVSDWLNQKWRGTPPPAARPATTVRLAPDAAFEMQSSDGMPAVLGDGCLRKTGAGAATIRSAYETRNSARRVEVREGTLTLGYGLPLVCAAGDTVTCERRPYGPEIAPNVAGADATRLVKEGDGAITLDAIPAGVSRLVVNGGELRLASPERAVRELASSADAVEAAIPEAGFESYPASEHSSPDCQVYDGGEMYGWHAVVPAQNPGKANSSVFFFDPKLNDKMNEAWKLVLQDDMSGVLVVKNLASAWCEIDVPADGSYVLSFRASPRNGWGVYAGKQLDVMIGRDADSLVRLDDFSLEGKYGWEEYSMSAVHLEAGRHQLWLKSVGDDSDRCSQFDDFRLTRVPVQAEWPLPNGGFENHTADFKNAFSADNTNRVPGFTVGQCTEAHEQKKEEMVSTFSVDGTDAYARFNKPWNRPGSRTQFCMAGAGTRLETTFVPPAGTWRFRADFCLRRYNNTDPGSYTVAASLRIGDEEVGLGSLETSSRALVARDWPNAFTADGKTPVTLTLKGGVKRDANGTWNDRNGHAVLDNLALAAVRGPSASILKDGGFESMDSWNVERTPKPKNVTGSDVMDYGNAGSFYQTYFGAEHFEGGRVFKIVNDDAAWQSVEIPTNGLYRFSANMASRCPAGGLNMNNGRNPVAFYLAKDGVTNWLGCTDAVAFSNYHEYAFLANVPAAGVYDVGWRGRSAWDGSDEKVDKTTLVDAAQFYRIETEKELDLPADLEIDVAKGARLSLDFVGTNEIARLVIGGHGRAGIVSLADCPELLGTLSGPGALFIRPRGTVLILR